MTPGPPGGAGSRRRPPPRRASRRAASADPSAQLRRQIGITIAGLGATSRREAPVATRDPRPRRPKGEAVLSPGLVFELTLVGIALGALYSLAALGIVLIYKTTGVLNFAHGAIGMFSTFIAFQFGVQMGWPAPIAILLALAFAAAFGWFMERFTLRPLRERAVLTRVIVTLGWLLILQAVASLIWRDTSYHVPLQIFPQDGVRLGQLTLGYNQIANIVIGAALAVLL